MFLYPKTGNDDAVSGKNELQLFSFITSILLERGFYLSFSSGAGHYGHGVEGVMNVMLYEYTLCLCIKITQKLSRLRRLKGLESQSKGEKTAEFSSIYSS